MIYLLFLMILTQASHLSQEVKIYFSKPNLHRILQHLLGLPSPLYDHHELITDDQGKSLAKRDDARSIHSYRMSGKSADMIKTIVAA